MDRFPRPKKWSAAIGLLRSSPRKRRSNGPRAVRRRGVQYASNAELGEVPQIGTPVRIGEKVRVRTVAPKLGKRNAEIFGRLGVAPADLAGLQARGVM